MKILICTIGSRGEVQPSLALALELKALGHAAVLCVSPNYQTWVESLGVACVPVGQDVRKASARIAESQRKKPSRAKMRKLMREGLRGTIREWFKVLGEAARGCDLVVVGGAMQCAGASIAQVLQIPYVYTAFSPDTLPSPNHPPPMIRSQSLPTLANRLLWVTSRWTWNRLFRDALNEERAGLGLAPISDVPSHIFTDRPWLAADPVLGPAASPDLQITQTGAWFLSESTPLPDELEQFLSEGEPPLYFGFGSMQASAQSAPLVIETARALGRRALVSQGWANLSLIDAGADCMSIGDVAHEKLFPRVAAIVHHGGAGTTATAARAGKPQIIVPHMYDQYYWAHRVKRLGVGVSGPVANRLTVGELVAALREGLKPKMTTGAQALAARIELHGARIAAQRLIQEYG